MAQKHCWLITDGRAGNENPAIGLAEAIARLEAHRIRRIRVKSGVMSRGLSGVAADAVGRHLAGTAGLAAPWPDLVIGCGKASAAVTAWVRAMSRKEGRPAFGVQLLKPQLGLEKYDLVIAPEHDRVSGANVISTIGSLTPVTDQLLEESRREFPHFAAKPGQTIVSVLIGGDTKRRKMSLETIAGLFDRLEEAGRSADIRYLISLSRRSGERIRALVQERMEHIQAILWDGTGENPYFAYLAHADAFIVTSDSINMISDAATTGKPVYVHHSPGMKAKFARFHQSLEERGIAREFTGLIENWAYEPLRETRRIAELVLERQKKCRATRTRQV